MREKKKKAQNRARRPPEQEKTTEYKALFEPPILLMESLGYKDKPSSLTYDSLFAMATRDSVIASIINTRISQVSSFTKPARYSSDHVGFEIQLRDTNQNLGEKEKQEITALENFIDQGGFQMMEHQDSFDTFIRKVLRDSLIYDQATFEIIRDRAGRPSGFVAVDAATIRAASEHSQYPNMDETGQKIDYVQVIDGSVVAGFTRNELAFGVRNPRTNIYLQPYGFSELEQLITQITSHLYAEEYNSRFFSQGGTTKGIINIKPSPNGAGVMNLRELESFKRQWNSQVSGLTGAWKLPVLQTNGVEFINVSQSNREMEFEKWMNYLINIACAVYQIDPAEVNFPNNGGVGGTGGGIFEGSNESRLKNSKDKGLRPLLRFLEDMINQYLVSQFSDQYTFHFVGMDQRSEEEQINLDEKAVRTYLTVNELRKSKGLEQLEKGDVILDSSWLGYIKEDSNGVDNPLESVASKDDHKGKNPAPEPKEGQYESFLEGSKKKDEDTKKSMSQWMIAINNE